MSSMRKALWAFALLLDLIGLLATSALSRAAQGPASTSDSCFEGPWDVEDNDSYLEANAPLHSGKDYHGHPNDAKGFLSILLDSAGQITVDLMDHSGEGVQPQLFYQSVAKRVAVDLEAPYHVEHVGQPGWYYIYVFAESGLNVHTAYNLRTTYPTAGPGPTEGRV